MALRTRLWVALAVVVLGAAGTVSGLIPGEAACLATPFVAVALVVFLVPGPAARQAAERAAIVELLEQRRFLQAIERGKSGQRRFGVWQTGAVLQALAELLLWRVDAATETLTSAATVARRSVSSLDRGWGPRASWPCGCEGRVRRWRSVGCNGRP